MHIQNPSSGTQNVNSVSHREIGFIRWGQGPDFCLVRELPPNRLKNAGISNESIGHLLAGDQRNDHKFWCPQISQSQNLACPRYGHPDLDGININHIGGGDKVLSVCAKALHGKTKFCTFLTFAKL